jgi:hypothetical protein
MFFQRLQSVGCCGEVEKRKMSSFAADPGGRKTNFGNNVTRKSGGGVGLHVRRRTITMVVPALCITDWR